MKEAFQTILKAKPFGLDEAGIAQVEKQLNELSVEEKVGQVFCVEYWSTDEQMIEEICRRNLGAVMTLPGKYDDFQESRKKFAAMKTPILIGGNLEEGADVLREGTNVANLLEVGATGDPVWAGKLGEITGKEAAAAGINWAFAPVTDIGMNYRNGVIATRVFGSDKDFVREASVQFVKELQTQNVACALKHFPGDGVDERDQHFAPSINSLSEEEWFESYGSIYKACIEQGAKTVMVGHIMAPALTKAINPEIADEDILPASTSKELLTGILRGRLGFNGMITTDATNMAGFDMVLPREKAIPAAINAGCDMILFTKNLEDDMKAMMKAAESGELSMERLDEAVVRVLGLKASLGLLDPISFDDVEERKLLLGSAEAKQAAQECADRSITLVKNKENLLPLDTSRIKTICLATEVEGRGFGSRNEDFAHYLGAKLEERGFRVIYHVENGEGDPFYLNGDKLREACDLILYATNLNSISNKAVTRLSWGHSMGKDAPSHINEVPTMFVSFGNPYHLIDVPRIKTFINAYKFNAYTVDAVLDKMLGLSDFTGVSPVDPFCGYWDTRL